MTDKVEAKQWIDTASAPSSGRYPAAAYLFNDGTLTYATELAVAKTRWQTTAVPERKNEQPVKAELTLTKGVLHAVITYSGGSMAFAALDRFPVWHFVNTP